MNRQQALIILTLSSLLSLSGCSLLHKDRPQAEDYKVNQSILKRTPSAEAEQTESLGLGEDESVATELDVEDRSVAPMKSIQEGPDDLQETPVFADDSPVSFASERVGLQEFAQTVFGELLGLNFTLGNGADAAADTMSLSLTRPVSKTRLYNIARNLLSSKGYQLYHKDGIVYISKPAKGGKSPTAIGIGRTIQDIPAAAGEILQIVPYTYNTATTISKAVLAMSNVSFSNDAQQKLFFVQGPRFEVARVVRIVNMLDVPALTGRVIDIIRLQDISPEYFIDQVTELLEQEGLKIGPNADLSFVALNRMNSVIVYSSDQGFTDRVRFWQEELDIAIGGDQKRFYIYRPKYSRAEDIGLSIRPFLSALANEAASAEQATSSRGNGGDNSADDKKTTISGPSMSVDNNQNALIFYEVPQKFKELKVLLDRLDVLPGQVALDVAIAEVELTDNVSSGIDWLYDSQANNNRAATLNLNSGAGTLALTAFDGDWKVALNLLDSVTDTRLLSKPYLVVRDGQTATINSGNQVPTVSQSAISTENPNVSTTVVQYRTTGVTLTVTPTINAEGVILLKISQQVSKSIPTDGFEVATPTITNRSVETEIYASDGRTVILGGLIQEETTYTDNGVPLVKDLPLLGNLFKSKGDDKNRSELLIMITARIIKNMNDLDEIAEKLKQLYSFPVDN